MNFADNVKVIMLMSNSFLVFGVCFCINDAKKWGFLQAIFLKNPVNLGGRVHSSRKRWLSEVWIGSKYLPWEFCLD